MNENHNIIDVQNISKNFGNKKVVDNITIQVEKGKIFGFLGPNGSGKTTTIRIICGLLTPDSGSGTCLGYDILSEWKKIRLNIGYMTQKFSYWEDLSIKENLQFVADMFSLKNKKEKIEHSLIKLGLEQRQNQLAGNLSGGWKQRLALAACIIHEPKLLLLDEPTAGVDPKARREFWDSIHKLAANGITVLVSTHYMDEAERCHKIIYISSGQIITHGTIDEVIAGTGLTTWIVKGNNLSELEDLLSKNNAVTSVAPFGNNMHVSGTNQNALKDAIKPYMNNPNYHWELSCPSMEDAFIHYMKKS